MNIVAIDPGASGGIAWVEDGLFVAVPMPDGMTAIVDALRTLCVRVHPEKIYMEKVGFFVPGDSPVGAVKFARHCGWLESALYAIGYPVEQVLPRAWMRGVFGSTLPKEKMARKRAIKEEMLRRHPHVNVTLKTADALGILEYALK